MQSILYTFFSTAPNHHLLSLLAFLRGFGSGNWQETCRLTATMDFPCSKPMHWYMGLSENKVYSQWNSHLIGIMISKTIGFRGTLFSDTPIFLPCVLRKESMKSTSFFNEISFWRRSRVWVQICCPSWRRAGGSGWDIYIYILFSSNSLVIFRGFCGFRGCLLGFIWILWDVFRDSDCGI